MNLFVCFFVFLCLFVCFLCFGLVCFVVTFRFVLFVFVSLMNLCFAIVCFLLYFVLFCSLCVFVFFVSLVGWLVGLFVCLFSFIFEATLQPFSIM